MKLNKAFIKELSIGAFMILCASLIAHYAIATIDERKGNILKQDKIAVKDVKTIEK
jgi:hypothetical protein